MKSKSGAHLHIKVFTNGEYDARDDISWAGFVSSARSSLRHDGSFLIFSLGPTINATINATHKMHSEHTHTTARAYSENIQRTLRKQSENSQRRQREHRENDQRRFREHTENIQRTLKECSENAISLLAERTYYLHLQDAFFQHFQLYHLQIWAYDMIRFNKYKFPSIPNLF